VKVYVGNIRVDDLQYPRIPTEGVTFGKLSEPDRREEIVDGRRYQTLTFKTRLTPVHAGEVDLTATMQMNVLRPRGARRGNDPFFDRFFNGFFSDSFAERQPIEIQARPARLTVLPLPEQGRPPDFNGAVGRFNFALDAKPTQLAVGDPITVRMEIRGSGNLTSVTAPEIPTDDRFRKYDPQPVKDEERPGQRVYEQVVIPRQADVTELPAVSFSFFDPEPGRYRTIRRGPVALQVSPAIVAGQPQVVSQGAVIEPPKAAEELGRDIVFIKDAPGRLRVRGARLYARPWFLALHVVPVAAFVGLLAVVRRRERFAADPRLVRFHHAGRQVRHSLSRLAAMPADGGRFYDELTAAIHSYLSAKLDLPPGAVERNRVVERLASDGTSTELRQQVSSFFDLVEGARYARNQAALPQREEALRLAHGIVEGLERQRGLSPRFAAGWLLLMIAGAMVFPHFGVQAQGEPKGGELTAFFQGNTAYQQGAYDVAARSYQQVVDAGLESGPLYFNLGNAHFKNGRLGRAILNYERAERILPRDPDVRVNLSYALELAHEEVPPQPFWQRLLFPFASRATTGQLATLASILWFALWGLLALRLVLPASRVVVGRAAWGVLAALLILGGSLAFRVQTVELRRAAVVVEAGETAVRFEPSENGTEHFRVHEGALLEVTDERNEWFQVRRRDGRRGWIPAGVLELVRATTA
jgi:tetratricopeptide (TPR) repeat protein